MNTVVVKETPTRYVIEVDRTSVAQGLTLLEADGAPVAVMVPAAEYDAFRAWQERQQALYSSAVPSGFEREVAAFERLKPALQEQYSGCAVAIYQGQVIAAGDDKMAVLGIVLNTLGPVPCYIEWVEPEAPRRARIPSARMAR
jgi:hypothetical protein